eukprot:6548306-Prymnesium_polylepis.2
MRRGGFGRAPVEYGDQLEAHSGRRYDEVLFREGATLEPRRKGVHVCAGTMRTRHRGAHKRFEPVGSLGRDIDLDDAVVSETGEQRCLCANGNAVLRIEGELLLANLQEADLEVGLERALVGVQHLWLAPRRPARLPPRESALFLPAVVVAARRGNVA